MTLSHRMIQLSFALNASLIIFLLSYFYPASLQSVADALFGTVSTSAQMRLYLFDAVILASAFVIALFAIYGVKKNAISEYEG